MTPELEPESTWSYHRGGEVLREKGLLDELPVIAEAYIRCGGGNQNLADRRELLNPVGWEQEVTAKYRVSGPDGAVSRRASFDAYKDGILVEHESGEQMRANWHLMKMEAAYRDSGVFDGEKTADAGVLLIPDYVNFPTLGRTKNDVRAFLANYFGFSIPFFVWEYPTK